MQHLTKHLTYKRTDYAFIHMNIFIAVSIIICTSNMVDFLFTIRSPQLKGQCTVMKLHDILCYMK